MHIYRYYSNSITAASKPSKRFQVQVGRRRDKPGFEFSAELWSKAFHFMCEKEMCVDNEASTRATSKMRPKFRHTSASAIDEMTTTTTVWGFEGDFDN